MVLYKSKNHINIVNLLSKCEAKFQTNVKSDWRLEQYLKAIFEILEQEEARTGKLNDELVASKKKAQFFQGLLEAQSKETLLEQYSAINSLSPNTNNASEQVSQTKLIHLNKLANYEKKLKKELFKRPELDGNKTKSSKNFDDIVKYHQLLQERVTNEMIGLVLNLKQNCVVSNEIIKKDTELLEKTNYSADKTVSNLRKNTEKIKEFANMACEYWLWISLFTVTLTFLSMVIFIRLFPQ